MALISVSGADELARLTAGRLECDLITESSLAETIAHEFGATDPIPDRAWPFFATSILAGLGSQHLVVIAAAGAERLLARFPAVLRVLVMGGDDESDVLTKRFGQGSGRPDDFDLVLNPEAFTPEQMIHLIQEAIRSKGLLADETLAPPHQPQIVKRGFGHPTEEIFANLLDFYRIGWEYEPRSFPLQWDKDGKVMEAFTPDFYLPEFDLFVELTTMKQALVTRKNRKIRLLRSIYPHVNIQVFYQKDLQDLIMKYGLTSKAGA